MSDALLSRQTYLIAAEGTKAETLIDAFSTTMEAQGYKVTSRAGIMLGSINSFYAHKDIPSGSVLSGLCELARKFGESVSISLEKDETGKPHMGRALPENDALVFARKVHAHKIFSWHG